MRWVNYGPVLLCSHLKVCFIEIVFHLLNAFYAPLDRHFVEMANCASWQKSEPANMAYVRSIRMLAMVTAIGRHKTAAVANEENSISD